MRTLIAVALMLITVQAAAGEPSVRFAVIADQTGGPMPGVYDSVLAEVARLDPDFIVTVGDQIEGYAGPDTASLRREFVEVFAQYDRAFGPRWRSGRFLVLTPGNHDITDDAAEPIWRTLVGPPTRRVDLEGVTILVIDTTRLPEDANLSPEQISFLENELAGVPPGHPIVVVTHKPFFRNGVWKGIDDPVHRLFVEHGVDAVLAGHWHTYVYEPKDGIDYIVCGSSGGGTGGQGLASGEFIGFLWGTIRDGRVELTPVSLGNVHALDLMSWSENEAMNSFQTAGLSMKPFDMSGRSSVVTVLARNPGDQANADSLRWTVPPNWTITPRVAPFAAAAGESTEAHFEAAYSGSPFPLPTVSAVLRYGRGKSIKTESLMRIARAVRCGAARKIRLDGRIDPAEWAAAGTESLLMSTEGSRSVCDPTEFFFAHDDRGVYLAARCAIEAGHPCKAEVAKRDGPITREDCAGWLLSPSDSVVVQIYSNPLGTVLDGRGPIVGGEVRMDYKWTGDIRVAARREADRWSVELYVPYTTLGFAKGEMPSRLRMNFRRKQPAVQSTADWMPFDFNPETMGTLDLVL